MSIRYHSSKIGTVSPLPRRTMTPSYASSVAVSSSTAIKPMPVSKRFTTTPRGANAAAQKTGITPRTVDSAYGSRLSTSLGTSRTVSPATKAVASRIPTPSTGQYTVNKTSRYTASVVSPTAPRRIQSLSSTPQRQMRQDLPDTLSRIDRELEPYTVDMHAKFKCYSSVYVLGTDGKYHQATVNQIMRTKGSKKYMYGVTYLDGYRPVGTNLYLVFIWREFHW